MFLLPKFKFFKEDNGTQKSEDKICHRILNCLNLISG